MLLENNGRFYNSKIPNSKTENAFTALLAQNAQSLKELSPDVLDQVYELAHVQSNLDVLKTYDMGAKKVMKETIDKIPESIQKDLSKNGIDVISIKNKLDLGLDKKTNSIHTSAKKEMFNFVANNKKANDDLLMNIDFDKYGKAGIPLKYSRNAFTADVKALLATLSTEKQKEIANHFNLKLTNDGFEGFPQAKSTEGLKLSDAEQKTVVQINKEIERFTLNNETTLTGSAEKALFDQLIKGSPEFTSTVGKLQHGDHAYSIDIHTMKVLQSAMKNPEYAKLSDKDKTVLKLAVLTHDLGKRGGQVDVSHPELGADYASAILDKYNLSQDIKERVTNLVRHSHFFEAFNTGKTDYRLGQLFRNPADQAIAKIFAQSDLESVSPGFADRKLGGKSFEEAFSSVGISQFGINNKKKTGNAHALRNFPKERFVINGKTQEVEILDLIKMSPDEDLTKYGLKPGTKKQDLRLVVHMVKDFSDIKNIHELSKQPNYDMILSSTYTDINVPDSYGTIGVSLSINPYNTGSFTNGTTGSQWGKGFDEFWDSKSNPSFGNVDLETIAKSKNANEGLALNPKIGQIIINSKDLTTDKIDPKIIQFANENNYRIIILGE